MRQLWERLEQNGVYKVGTADLGEVLPPELSHLRYSVTLVYPLLRAVVEEIDDAPTFAYFHHYRTVNTFLDQQALFVAGHLQKRGYNAFPIAASQSVKREDAPYAGLFPHKTAAVLAGLGWIGKSGLLVTPEYGPRVRLATVLTDLPLPASFPMENRCGGCTRCVERCPAMAMTGENYRPGAPRETVLDAAACSHYMKRHFQHIGRGAVCGICVAVCPWGKTGEKAIPEGFLNS